MAEITAAMVMKLRDDTGLPMMDCKKALQESGGNFELAAMLHHAGIASSKGDGKRSIEGGGISIGGRKISDRDYKVVMTDSVEGKLFLLRKGKKQYHIVKIV